MDPSPTDVARRLRERGETVGRVEVRRALDALEGPVSDRERQILAAMAEGIVDGVLAAPVGTLRNGADARHAEVAARLFRPGDDDEG